MEAHGTSYLNLGQFREEKSLLQKEEAETLSEKAGAVTMGSLSFSNE